MSEAPPRIAVYTQPHCSNCRRVERFLRERGLRFDVYDVASDPGALEEITSRGFMTTPVTRIGEEWVAGFRQRTLERLLT